MTTQLMYSNYIRNKFGLGVTDENKKKTVKFDGAIFV